MSSSDGDNCAERSRDFLRAVSQKRGKGAEISEKTRCREMQTCLDQGADINAVGSNDDTALHKAVKRGYREAVTFLRQKGARTDIHNQQNCTAITLAENFNKKEIASIIKEPLGERSGQQSRLATKSTSIDNEKPSTSRESTLPRQGFSPARMFGNRSDDPGLVAKRKLNTDNKYNQNAKVPRLALNFPLQLKRHSDGAITTGSGGPSVSGDSNLERNEKRAIQPSLIEEKETYTASGLKHSLHGIAYQWKHLMLIMKRALTMGQSFRLATEMDAAEKFDDIVLEYEVSPGNKVHRFVQVKHKQEETDCKMVTANHLLDIKDGEFSMLKYFISWRKIMKNPDFSGSGSKKFILCTNIGLDVEGLKYKNIDVIELAESDEFLNVTMKTEQLPRFYKLADKPSELCDTLKLASDVHLLARDLADRIRGSKNFHLNTDLIKRYRIALVQEVIDLENQRFSVNFVRNNNLSAKAENLRKIFFFHTKKLSRRNVSEKDFWNNLEARKLNLSKNFVKKFELGEPDLTHVGPFSDEFVKLVNNAWNDKVVKIDRRVYNKSASDQSIERIFADNIDKLAGHVLIADNGIIKFRSQFLNDGTQLLENIKEFQNSLKSQLGRKFTELYKFKFDINDFKTCTEEELSLETELPVGDIRIGEISEFLNSFVLAVNQPNEKELGEMVEREIGEDTPFNQLETGFITDSFQNAILHWLKGKKGTFLNEQDAQDFFDEMEDKLACLLTMDRSLEYSEKLKKLGIEFNFVNTELQNFINSPLHASNQVLELASEKTLLTALQVYQTLAQPKTCETKQNFIFIPLKILSARKIMKQVLRAFEWSRDHDLLIVDCEAMSAGQYSRELWNPLRKIMAQKSHKKLIVITQIGEELSDRFNLGCQIYHENNGDHSFHNLSPASQNMLLERRVTKFQGKHIETSLGKLLGIRDSDNFRADESEDLSELIDSDTLLQLISKEEIEVGYDFEKISEIWNCYVNRMIYRHFVIKEDIFKDERIDDLFAISNIEGETPSIPKNLTNITFLRSMQEEKQFKTLCARHTQCNVHWLKRESGKYVWIQSQGDITYLIEHRDLRESDENDDRTCANYLTESQLADRVEPVIICDIAGMGKSTLLTYLAREIKTNEPNSWVHYVDLNHHVTALEKVTEKSSYNLYIINEAVDFLVKELVFHHETELAKKVFKRMIEQRHQVVLIFDGFDEISPTHGPAVINLLRTLVDSGIKKLYVATRPRTRAELERGLKVISYEIRPLLVDEQEYFLTEFWKTKFGSQNEDRIKTYAKAIMEKLAYSITDPSRTFTGNPLHTRLVAEIFENHSERERENFDSCEEFINAEVDQPTLPEKIDLIYLYKNFMDKKFAIYFIKTLGNLVNEAVKELRVLRYNKFIETHEELALDALFTKDKTAVLLSCRQIVSHRLSDQTNLDIVEERTGIITQFIGNQPHFGHRTYAEYFAALFLSTVLEKHHQDLSLRKIFIGDILLAKHYRNIRAFLNCLLSEKHYNALEGESWKRSLSEYRSEFNETIFHVAAAESNLHISELFLNSFKTNPEDRKSIVNIKDNYGRTAVHLAVRCGNLDGIRLLVENTYFEINSRDMMGETPLYAAVVYRKLDAIEYLFNKDADIQPQDKFSRTPLHAAAHQGALEVVKYLLDKGADIDVKNDFRNTPLHVAVNQSNSEVVKYLLDKGADVQSKNIIGSTPLHVAVLNDDLKVMKYLLDKGADVQSQSNKGSTPLHTAAYRGKLEVVKYLLDKGADVQSQDNKGSTPLHTAAYRGKSEVVKYLLDKESRVQSQNNIGWTPLHGAAHQGELEIVKYLFDKGVGIQSHDYIGWTPLHEAALRGKLEVVEYLLDKGADIQSRDNIGWTPLHAATQNGELEVVKYLFDKGADVQSQDHIGWTSLHEAALKGKLEVAEYLLHKGADVQSKDNVGWTPLHAAAQNGELKLVEYLRDKGADIQSQDNVGWTPLHEAAHQGKLKVVKCLFNKGADVQSQDHIGWTSLHEAALKGKLEVAEYLLHKGADVQSKDNVGWTPLHAAAQNGELKLVEYLLDKGADIQSQDNVGWTPLHEAAHQGELEAVKCLFDKGANIQSQDHIGWTSLHAAAQRGKLDIVQYLVNKGDDVNSQTNDGWTPLLLAARASAWNVVKYLLANRASVLPRTMAGRYCTIECDE